MAGERDVLAEAQAFLDEARVLVEPSPEYDDWLVRAPAVIRSLFAATFSALAALSKSAPDLEACIGDPSHQYHSHDDDPIAAPPPAEPALREEHCCNDPAHMSPEYLAAAEGSAGTGEWSTGWFGVDPAAEGSARDGG